MSHRFSWDAFAQPLSIFLFILCYSLRDGEAKKLWWGQEDWEYENNTERGGGDCGLSTLSGVIIHPNSSLTHQPHTHTQTLPASHHLPSIHLTLIIEIIIASFSRIPYTCITITQCWLMVRPVSQQGLGSNMACSGWQGGEQRGQGAHRGCLGGYLLCEAHAYNK